MKRLKRITALILTVFVCFYSAPMVFAQNEESVVIISSEEDFDTFVKNCRRDVWSKGLTVELQRDLNLSGRAFTPIPVFQGTFHGNGHIIRGISFTQKGSKVGLFRSLSETASVEDLVLDGSIEAEGSASQVGLIAGENYGTISNCTVNGMVTAQEDVGGLVGFNGETGVVQGCVVDVKVRGVTNSGGVAGNNEGILRQCTNRGEVNTASGQEVPSNVGGIAGLSRGVIQECQNNGRIGYDHVGYNIGGIAGLQSGEIRDCSNTKPVKGRKDIGGIAGQMEPVHHLSYASSPIDALDSSLSGLFDEMEALVDEVSDITDQGAEDARVINDALSNIQGYLYDAGKDGLKDLDDMGDDLHASARQIRLALESFHGSLSELNEALKKLIELIRPMQQALEEIPQAADVQQQDVQRLKDSLVRIEEQAGLLQKHLREIEDGFQAYDRFAQEIIELLELGKTNPSFFPDFPDSDVDSQIRDTASSLLELSEDVEGLADQWKTILEQLPEERAGSIKEILAALIEVAHKLHQTSESFSNTFKTVIQQCQRALRAIRDFGDSANSNASSTLDDIDDELDVIHKQVRRITDSVQSDNSKLHDISSSIFDCLDAVRQSIYDMTKKPELTVTDLSPQITEGPGAIIGCTSSATVEGDSNTGGIVGSVSTERRSDPEATFLLDDFELLSDAYATLRAVIRECRFDGDVIVKNNYGGGIAGSCEAGAIVDCVARANVETGLDYCGGIVGRTKGTIERCAALADLTGESWVGGITGFGNDISSCRSMVRSDSEGEYQGAIAGDSDGELSNNRYLFEDVAGLDGVDYAEKAQGMSFDEFSQLDYIPSDFLTFSYRFEVNGELIEEIPFEYGEDLDLSRIPSAPERSGKYGEWPEYPTENLTRSMVLRAQFEEPTSILSSDEEFAQLLAQGIFAPSASISIKEKELPTEPMENGALPVKALSYGISGSQEETVQLRLRTDGIKHPAAAIYRNGGWIPVDSVLDGSYLVFDAPCEGSVLLMQQKSSLPRSVLIGGASVVILVILFVVYRKRKKTATARLPEGEDDSKSDQSNPEEK